MSPPCDFAGALTFVDAILVVGYAKKNHRLGDGGEENWTGEEEVVVSLVMSANA